MKPSGIIHPNFLVFLLCSTSLLACFGNPAYGQAQTDQPVIEEPEDHTKQMIEALANSHRVRLGPFRILPSVRINGGYDSNALFTENQIIGDYFFSASPGASVGVKMGHRVFVRVIEDLTFLYYRKIQQRRDIYNTTRGEFITGTSRLVAILDGGYNKRKAPVDQEIDIPIQHTTTDASANISYYLGNRINLRPGFHWTRTQFDKQDEVNGIALAVQNHQTESGSLGLEYLYRPNLHFTSDFVLGHSSSDQSNDSSLFWNLLLGANLLSNRLAGHVAVGFGEADFGENQRHHHLLLLGNVTYRVNNRMSVGGFISRQYQTSAFLSQSLRLTTNGGVTTSLRLTNRISTNAGYSLGVNDYGDALVAGQPVKNDHFRAANFGVSVRIIQNISVHLQTTYSKRDSDISILNKKRFTYSVGIGFSYSFLEGGPSSDNDDQ